MKRNTTLLIRINEDLKKQIQEIADKNDVSVSEIINVYLKDIAKNGDLDVNQRKKLGIEDKTHRGLLDVPTIKRVVTETIEELKLQNKIKKVYLFGSYSRGEAKKDSDIDLRLVTTDQITLFEIGNIRYYITEKTGKEVDITNVEPEEQDPDFYSEIKKDEFCIYEK